MYEGRIFQGIGTACQRSARKMVHAERSPGYSRVIEMESSKDFRDGRQGCGPTMHTLYTAVEIFILLRVRW